MPATSKQKNTAQMAKAVKSGALKMRDVPVGARAAVRSMMDMSSGQLDEMMHSRTRRKGRRS